MALEIKQLTIKSKIVYEKNSSQKMEEELKWRRRQKEIVEQCMAKLQRELSEQSNMR